MLEPKCPHKEIPMKKSTLGLIVCLVIAVIVSIAAGISVKKAKAERDANNLRERKRIEHRKYLESRYTGDCMYEPQDPVPLARSTNSLAR
jgi:hypothetical protein